jgi:hypothetical protein
VPTFDRLILYVVKSTGIGVNARQDRGQDGHANRGAGGAMIYHMCKAVGRGMVVTDAGAGEARRQGRRLDGRAVSR